MVVVCFVGFGLETILQCDVDRCNVDESRSQHHVKTLNTISLSGCPVPVVVMRVV